MYGIDLLVGWGSIVEHQSSDLVPLVRLEFSSTISSLPCIDFTILVCKGAQPLMRLEQLGTFRRER